MSIKIVLIQEEEITESKKDKTKTILTKKDEPKKRPSLKEKEVLNFRYRIHSNK